MVKLLFFASLREALGTASESIAAAESVADVGRLRQYLATRGGVWAVQFAAGRNLRAAVNQDMAAASTDFA